MKRIFALLCSIFVFLLCSNAYAASFESSLVLKPKVEFRTNSMGRPAFYAHVDLGFNYTAAPFPASPAEGSWSLIAAYKNDKLFYRWKIEASSGYIGMSSRGFSSSIYSHQDPNLPYIKITEFLNIYRSEKYVIEATFTYKDPNKEPDVFRIDKPTDILPLEVQFKKGYFDNTVISPSKSFLTKIWESIKSLSRDPIELSSGNMFIEANDIILPGQALGLKFSRMYNSRDNQQRLLGYGWRTNYDYELIEMDNGDVYEFNSSGAGTHYILKQDGSFFTPNGKYSTLIKNDAGSYTLTRRHGEKQTFNTQGKLIRAEDARGNFLVLSYNAGSILTSVEDSAGRKIEFTTDADRIVQAKDPLGRITKYDYDSSNNLIKITDPANNEVHYVYDDDHNIIEMTNPNGNKTYYAYDEQDRAYMNWQDGDKNKETLSFDSDTQTTLTDANGNSTIYEFNKYGLTTKIIEADGATTEYIYNANLQKSKVIDPNGKETTFTYFADKNLETITDSQGRITKFTYNTEFNKIQTVTDTLNNVTSYEYDTEGNLIKLTDALNNITEYTYDEQGNCLSVKDPLNNVTRFEYDEFANLIKTTDALNNETTITYDAAGNPLTVTDAKGNITTNTYDVLNRLKEIAYPDTSSVSVDYDGFGNKIKATNALGLKTNYIYDNAERLITVTDPATYTVINSYDLFGNPLSVTDQNGNVTSLVYDNKNRLKEEINALDKKTVYEYDLFDRVVSKTDAKNNIINYVYDELGNLVQTRYPDSTMVTYSYDELNRRASMTDGRGTTTYVYDQLSRIVSIDGPAENDTISYTYNAVGNKLTMMDQDGSLTEYGYDELNRLITVSCDTKVTTYTYDKLSNVTNILYPNGATVENTYNNMNRLINHINKDLNGVVISSYALEYNKAGMIVKKTLANGTWIEYGYDTLNRLLSEIKKVQIGAITSELSNETYEYDPAGNRTSFTKNLDTNQFWKYKATGFNDAVKNNLTIAGFGTDAVNLPLAIKKTYVYNQANQLNTWSHDIAVSASQINVDTGSYDYDDNGNRLKMTTLDLGQVSALISDYVYDYENKLRQVSKDNQVVNYVYDGAGKRVSRELQVDSTVTEYTKYLYDGLNVVIERDRDDATQLSYLRAPGYAGGISGIISMNKGGADSYYHYDNLGSVVNMTDSNGLASPDLSDNKYTFSSKEYDPITGLHYFGARYYDKQIGRWLTPDPMGFVDGPNLYAYVSNNPVNYSDPNGLFINPITNQVIMFFHYNVRDHFNKGTPTSIQQAKEESYVKLGPIQNVYHQFGKEGAGNIKYISSNGRKEVIFDTNGNVVTDVKNTGSYNFFSPEWGLHHFMFDVVPYFIYGNGHGDSTNMLQRELKTLDVLPHVWNNFFNNAGKEKNS